MSDASKPICPDIATGLAGPFARQPMKLRPTAFLMLGMLRLGVRSGYAIKRATDLSTRFFWPTSLAAVYPELGRLERAGLVIRREDPHGARARAAYEISEQGEAALEAWLRSPRQAPLQFRDEGVLRLFFADVLDGEDQLALVRRQRQRALAGVTQMRLQIIPTAMALEENGTRFPAIVARLGADTYAYVAQWLEHLEESLEDQQPAEGSPTGT
jgi:DNA-binding PadR family transcriptional regulator